MALSCEIKAKEEMCWALEKAKEESQKQQEALAMQASKLIITLFIFNPFWTHFFPSLLSFSVQTIALFI